ncbi:MAG: hypothetical protein M1817_005014 [Caeruleum heppii]|nr:MAG: hypothetical protein M1817_005014 [Caeruleum heppii]
MSIHRESSSRRPRIFSSASHRSNKSHKSSNSITKMDLHETPQEKHRSTLKSKADPTLAMTEEQPSSVAAGQASIESIRSMQHKDRNGNPIADPDRSNPTRPRWERPLDTIRSFEAAVDGRYSSSKGFGRVDSSDALNGFNSHWRNGNGRLGQDGGYNNSRTFTPRPDSFVDNYYGGGPTPNRSRPYQQRMVSDHGYNHPLPHPPALNGYPSNGQHPSAHHPHGPYYNGPPTGNAPPLYPTHGYQQSYDTVATSASGSGSHATDAWGNSTDPSSDNSSLDRIPEAPKPDLGEEYGFTGFGEAPPIPGPSYGQPEPGKSVHASNVHSPLGPSDGHHYGQRPDNMGPPPPPPHKDVAPTRTGPIKLGGPSASAPMQSGMASPDEATATGKRRSWFKRFSKA